MQRDRLLKKKFKNLESSFTFLNIFLESVYESTRSKEILINNMYGKYVRIDLALIFMPYIQNK